MWDFILHRLFGVGSEGPERVKIGAGVVGNTTYAVLAACAAVSAVAWGLNQHPGYAVAVIAIIAGLAAFFFLGTWIFAHLHPDQAAMGGSEWRRFREAQLASKHSQLIDASPTIPDPLQALPPNTSGNLLNAPDKE